MKNNIYNLIIILLLFFIIIGIGIIIKKDINKVSEHLKHCEELCYPGVVVKEFSKSRCVCQNEVQIKYPLDK